MSPARPVRRVLHVAPAFSVMGGVSALVASLFSSSLADEFELRLVPSHVDGTRPRKFAAAAKGMIRAEALLARGWPDLVHLHIGDFPSPQRKWFFQRLALAHKVPAILHVHGARLAQELDNASRPAKAMVGSLISGAQKTLCLSRSWRDALAAHFPGADYLVVPNGVALPEVPAAPFARTPPTLLFLGRIGPRKGVFDLVRALIGLGPSCPPLRLVAAGNGDVEELRRAGRDLPPAVELQCPGWVAGEAKEELLRNADLFVLPSHAEGLPMSVLEAMAFGLPVVATRVGGIPELVRHEESGLLVAPGDHAALGRAVAALAADPQAARAMGARGREITARDFSLEMLAKRLGALYTDL